MWSPAPRSHPAGGVRGGGHRAYRGTGGAPGYHAQPCPSAPDAGTGGHKGRPYRGRDAGRRKDCPRRRPNASSRKDCPHRSRDAGGRKGCPHRQWAAGRRRAGTACRRREIRSVHLAAGRGLEAGRLWQRGYYDHIVRSENDFLRIWTYIDNNPLRWSWIATTQRDRTGETLCRQRPRP